MNCTAYLYTEESTSLDHSLSACHVSTLTLNRKLLDTHGSKLWGLWLLSGRRRKKCDKIRFFLCFINLSQIFVSQDVSKPKKPKSISDNGGDKKDGNNEGENADDDHNRKREWGQA